VIINVLPHLQELPVPLRVPNALDSPDSTSSTHVFMPMPLMNPLYVLDDLRLHTSPMKKGRIDGVDPDQVLQQIDGL
jgi:hypothetical protein